MSCLCICMNICLKLIKIQGMLMILASSNSNERIILSKLHTNERDSLTFLNSSVITPLGLLEVAELSFVAKVFSLSSAPLFVILFSSSLLASSFVVFCVSFSDIDVLPTYRNETNKKNFFLFKGREKKISSTCFILFHSR